MSRSGVPHVLISAYLLARKVSEVPMALSSEASIARFIRILLHYCSRSAMTTHGGTSRAQFAATFFSTIVTAPWAGSGSGSGIPALAVPSQTPKVDSCEVSHAAPGLVWLFSLVRMESMATVPASMTTQLSSSRLYYIANVGFEPDLRKVGVPPWRDCVTTACV
ncbi:hypothetical protein K466DRAFT_288832 [Polyporus arcularius HHB13444]|uniref:Uncharacterized protein n=1 Tax=Polyporus arcularius HHB13444 TaxID=1314778 RepID=A0A5C3NZP2_9APHY|nr:hypothetical protein K466DRAFT_288832 [Polyporus arcularius HHB13444]